jgi:adenylate kinase
MQPLTLVFLGPQGSGKGTQIDLIKKYIEGTDPTRPIVHFEMGKNLRELGARADYTGKHTHEILQGGGLIPYAVSASLFAQYLMQHLSTNEEHLIVDGFPRTATQVPTLDSALIEFYQRRDPAIVVVQISDEEAVKRLTLRGRHDDTEESIRTRLEWSRRETMPNIGWFRNNNAYRVLDINGEQSVEHVHKDILAALQI